VATPLPFTGGTRHNPALGIRPDKRRDSPSDGSRYGRPAKISNGDYRSMSVAEDHPCHVGN